MPELVEVAIKATLLARLETFAQAQSPAITISDPNVEFTPPSPVTPAARWLRASLLPAQTTSIISGHKRYQGLLQVDVMHGQKAGELEPTRVAAALIAFFPLTTRLTHTDGFIIQINRAGYLGPLMTEGVWAKLPVRIPYECFTK